MGQQISVDTRRAGLKNFPNSTIHKIPSSQSLTIICHGFPETKGCGTGDSYIYFGNMALRVELEENNH